MRVGKTAWYLGGLVLAVLITHLAAALAPLNSLMYWFPTDDAFYYFQVARNIGLGNGVTFDGANPANGFHPLWMLICIPVFRLADIDPVLPLRVLVMVLAGFNAATAVLLYRFLNRFYLPATCALIAAVWAFSPIIHRVTTLRGMETGLVALSLVVLMDRLTDRESRGWEKLSARDDLLLGLAAVLVVFSRLDNIFLVAVAGLWVVFRRGGFSAAVIGYLTGGIAASFLAFFLRLGFPPEFPEFLPGLAIFLAVTAVVRVPLYVLFASGRVDWGGDVRAAWFGRIALLRAPAAWLVGSLLVSGLMIALSGFGLVVNFPRLVLPIESGLSMLVMVGGSLMAPRSGNSRLAGWQGLRAAFSTWLWTGLRYAAPLVITLSLYMAWNQASFGTFMPVSGQIKHWWGALGDTIYGRPVDSFAGLFGFGDPDNSPWSLGWAPFLSRVLHPVPLWAALMVSALAVVLVAVRRSAASQGLSAVLGVLFSASLLQVLYYNGTYYVNLRLWYWVAQMLLWVIIWGLGVDMLFRSGFLTRRPILTGSLTAAVVVAVLVNYVGYQLRLVPPQASARSTYPDLAEARELERLTEPGARIGMTGGGVVAYFIRDRTVINLDGLMNSAEYFHAFKRGQGEEAVKQLDLDYLFGGEYILLETNPYRYALDHHLEKLAPLGGGYVFRYHSNFSSEVP